MAWHGSRNEFGILYVRRASPWDLRVARVTTTGSILDDRVVTTVDAEPLAAQLGFSPSTGNYIALWANAATGRITAAELTPDGSVLMRAELPASILGGQLGMALTYNPVSGTFLLLGFSNVAMTRGQIRGVELNSHGAPVSSVIEVTGVPQNPTLFAPRAAARADAAEWLVDAESMAGWTIVEALARYPNYRHFTVSTTEIPK